MSDSAEADNPPVVLKLEGRESPSQEETSAPISNKSSRSKSESDVPTKTLHRSEKKEEKRSAHKNSTKAAGDSGAKEGKERTVDKTAISNEKTENSDSAPKKKKRVAKKKANVVKKDGDKPTGSSSEEQVAETSTSNVDVASTEESKGKKSSKRRERARKKVQSTNASGAQKSLSAEGLAMLKQIADKAEARRSKSGLRTGKISVIELMGDGENLSSDLQRLRLGSVSPEALLQTAFSQMPMVPGFPSLTHRPDPGPFSSSFRPELFKTTMEAYASAAALHGHDDGFGNSIAARGKYSPDQVLPWVSFAPMYPIDTSRGRPNPSSAGVPGNPGFRGPPSGGPPVGRPPFQSNPNGGYRPPVVPHNQQFNARPNESWSRPSASSTSHVGNNQQKTRKPFFMPYLSAEAVARGLANGDLIKGSLRVNQRNYEESYIDNPEGNEQADLLILGIHDRNRALHGDTVVVRVKGREDWVVRESLYTAWRTGHLKLALDDDGKPVSIPPIPSTEKPIHVELLNGLVHAGEISPVELDKPVPQSEEKVYDRKEMLLIAAQGEHASSSPPQSLTNDLQKKLDDFSIGKADEAPVPTLPVQKSPPQRKPRSQQAGGNRRNNYRMLYEMPDEDWGMPDACLQKTAEVVMIADQKNCRAAMGQLKPMADGNRNWALFSPTDSRMPRMLIPHDQLPMGFFERPHDYQRFIFVARMEEWQATAQFARGKLERTLGEAGDIDAETEGLLIENSVDTREFSHSALSSLPITDACQWKIDEKEFKYRRDLRERTIFTIDPKTARDLDDALSIDECEDIDGKGTPGWEVGVHIADVTQFLLEGTELDKWASQRATSVYLVHKVVPMLPRILCEQLCSLNSGVDRLSFSVIFKMDREGNVKEEWFGRTIIRSCCQMSYEHAQDLIENPDKDFPIDELPELHNGFTTADVKAKVLALNEVAQHLRRRRELNGSLRLDQPKLKFALDDETKVPCGVSIYERKDSNSLVEEFMLLANLTVAKRIEEAFPTSALLRCHPPPKQKILREVIELCEKMGFPLDASSSGLLSSSLRKFEGNKTAQTAINQVLSSFMMKPMQLARYFCTGSVKSKSAYHHYALNMDYYTHFTSPIRRYADVLVHRMLAAALGYAPPPALSTQEIESQAEHCNWKKNTAKAVSDQSAETFFGLFVKQCGPLAEKAVVVNVLDQAFDVLVLKYGVVKRVYVNRLDMAHDPTFEKSPPVLTLYWNPTCGKPGAIEQRIELCSVVDVVLSALPEPTKYMAVVKMCPRAEARTLHDLVGDTLE